jgi:hypothetical protein
MSLPTGDSRAFPRILDSTDDTAELSRLEARLPLLLSMIAGMVDSTGFFTLGHVFTAHVTGNIVLAAGVAVDGGSFHWAQLLAVPVFMLALATVWLVAQASRRHGPSLARLLLLVQFLLLVALLIFSQGICRSGWSAGRHGRNDGRVRHGLPVRPPPPCGAGRDLDSGDDGQFGERGLVSDGLANGPPSPAAARFNPAESLAWSLAWIPCGLRRSCGSRFIGRRLGLDPSGCPGSCCSCGEVAAAGGEIAPSKRDRPIPWIDAGNSGA